VTGAGLRGPRVRGHHTALRREQKKHKLPVANNVGLVGSTTWLYGGGEILEREGKRKHWRQLADKDGIELSDQGIEIVDEEEQVEGVILPEGEVEMVQTLGPEKAKESDT
jgi:hypothetical protein